MLFQRFIRHLLLPCALIPAWVATPLMAQTLPHQSSQTSIGAVNCASSTCHGSIEERSSTPVRQNEYTTWLRQDRHARAYQTLLTEDSQRIVRNLGLKKPAHESAECLDCHSHNPPAQRRGERFDIKDGVSCEACHGPAGQWVKTHVEPKPSHTRNIQAGLYPSNQPGAVAKLCASCHQGDSTRPITHQIMGAGHPRLSLELDTFLALQPPHYSIDRDWKERKGSFDSAKLWAMGQLASAINLMELIQDPKRNRQGLVPELMMFDCHACHSPMSKKDWHPQMGQSPGQLRINNGSLSMVYALIKGALPQQAAALKTKIQALHTSSTNPVGTSEQLMQAASALGQTLKQVRDELTAISLDTPKIKAVVKEIVAQGTRSHYVDFAQAEQVLMALSTLTQSLPQGNAGLSSNQVQAQPSASQPRTIQAALDALYGILRDDEKFDRQAFEAGLLPISKAFEESTR